VFGPGKTLQLSLLFAINTRAYPSGAFLGAPLKGGLLTLIANIISGWKGLKATNTLAFWASASVTKKMFYIINF